MPQSQEVAPYVTSLVTFIDILGFRSLVESDATGIVVLNTLKLVGHFASQDDEMTSVGGRAIRFSDSVVRITPLLGTWLDRALFVREVEELAYIQGELMISGVLLRGGIAVGNACAQADLAFGPAFNAAYALESQRAVHPRIVLDSSLIDTYGQTGDMGRRIHADDGLPLTRRDEDGQHFVDYLRNFPRELHDENWRDSRDELYRDHASRRRKVIEVGLARHEAGSSVGAKFLWLARYHNDVTRELLPSGFASLAVDCEKKP